MTRLRNKLLDGATYVAVICTIIMTGVTLNRQFGPGSQRPTGRSSQPPVRVDNWDALVRDGRRFGPDTAGIKMVVFADFECPGCAGFATVTYPDFEARYRGQVSLVYRHWPLTKHKLAYAAARAAECAGAQGRFKELHDTLYAQQQRIGMKSFRQFATEAGVKDLRSFDACTNSDAPVHEIDRDIAAARSIGGTGTPTVLVNGWLFREGIDSRGLDSLASALGFQPKPAAPVPDPAPSKR
jgi:protein-disulfide isomerase